jgi:hypothetical protein
MWVRAMPDGAISARAVLTIWAISARVTAPSRHRGRPRSRRPRSRRPRSAATRADGLAKATHALITIT